MFSSPAPIFRSAPTDWAFCGWIERDSLCIFPTPCATQPGQDHRCGQHDEREDHYYVTCHLLSLLRSTAWQPSRRQLPGTSPIWVIFGVNRPCTMLRTSDNAVKRKSNFGE